MANKNNTQALELDASNINKKEFLKLLEKNFTCIQESLNSLMFSFSNRNSKSGKNKNVEIFIIEINNKNFRILDCPEKIKKIILDIYKKLKK